MPTNLCRFYDVWQAAREDNDGGIPYRRQLGLPVLRALSAHLVVFERIGPGDLRVKMSGTAMDALFDRNLTGASIYDVAERNAGDAMVAFYEALLDHPAGGYACDILVMETGKRIRAEYLTLPLLNRDGERVQVASLCETEIDGYGLPSKGLEPRITYSELVSVSHLDIGLGLPDYTFTMKGNAPDKK